MSINIINTEYSYDVEVVKGGNKKMISLLKKKKIISLFNTKHSHSLALSIFTGLFKQSKHHVYISLV